MPTLIEESVKIVWDMVMLNPPAISLLPQVYCEDWHDKHATKWKDSRGANSLVYYNPVLFYGFTLDVARKGEVGNMPPGSASTGTYMCMMIKECVHNCALTLSSFHNLNLYQVTPGKPWYVGLHQVAQRLSKGRCVASLIQ